MTRLILSPLSRRGFMTGGAAALGVVAMPAIWRSPAEAGNLGICLNGPKPYTGPNRLDPPSFDLQGARFIAGVRPARRKTFRLDAQDIGDKSIVHNYGHGGAGITMSWGCAIEVRRLVREIVARRGPGSTDKGIAILGCGVMGMTAAVMLARDFPRLKITVYAKEIYPYLPFAESRVASQVAGGQWCPSSVKHEDNDKARARFKRILVNSHLIFKMQVNQGYGVSPRTNYTLKPSDPFRTIPDLVRETQLHRLPFNNMTCSGFSYETLLVEPPVFLMRVFNRLKSELKVNFAEKTFTPSTQAMTPSDSVLQLTEKIIVNCTGFGAKAVVKDDDMHPIKGHLVLLRPQPGIKYLFSGYDDCDDWVQYIFPRQDAVVIGGTYQEDKTDVVHNDRVGKKMVSTLVDVFAGKAPTCDCVPDVHGVDTGVDSTCPPS